MRSLIIIIICSISSLCAAKQLRVAIIDTGFSGTHDRLCATGHYDFVYALPTIGADHNGHGTNVVKTIETYGGYTNYCFLIYKVFGVGPTNAGILAAATIKALEQGADVINMSYSGGDPSELEHEALRKTARLNVKVFIAAGNEHNDLDAKCNAYPACYKVPGVIVVGSVDEDGKRHGNYGTVVDEDEPHCYGTWCGTSVSTAIATGKYLHDKQDEQ